MRGGLRLPRTAYMSDSLYQLMLTCWMSDPDERPDWTAINATLRGLAAEPEQVPVPVPYPIPFLSIVAANVEQDASTLLTLTYVMVPRYRISN